MSRFSVLKIKPFTQEQALLLVDKLERPEDPVVKDKFKARLAGPLYNDHRSFIENPLLLTILLLTFEKFADIPTQLHLFYRKAYITLSEAHDATKGGFRRVFKSGLIPEKIADYFAEFCFLIYKDFKFEFTADEFAQYYEKLKMCNKSATTASGLLYDLCNNLCLLTREGERYSFAHRTFQEYFCAIFFSLQDAEFLKRLLRFVESRHKRMYSDQTFSMLYDMNPHKIEQQVFVPFLQGLFDECDAGNGYWTFLKKTRPSIRYCTGEIDSYPQNPIESYLLVFILEMLDPDFDFDCEELPDCGDLEFASYGYIWNEDSARELVEIETIEKNYPWVESEPEAVGWAYEFEVAEIQNGWRHEDLRTFLNNDRFRYKSEYNAARAYLEKLKGGRKVTADYFDDYFEDV
jgi:hypothetical protein